MDFVLKKIDQQLGRHRRIDQDINELRRKLKYLNAVKEDIESRKSAELNPRKKLKSEVSLWLKFVERINGEIQSLEQTVGESSAALRGFHAESVSKKIEEVEELLQRGKSLGSLVLDQPQWIGQALSTTTLVGEAPKVHMKKICDHLMDDEVQKIGVCGMGGVGKTTIMKLINNQLLQERDKFDIVIWVTVSKEMISIFKLQEAIANGMGRTLSNFEDETVRAGKLHEMLFETGRYVLILDDLWQKLPLEKVGIPEPSKGSKLLLTTRSLDVCRWMGCKDVILNSLAEGEAWDLFLDKVGQDILNHPNLVPTAKLLANRCAGLPLAIISVASTMKGLYDVSEWRNAYEELSKRLEGVNEFGDEVFQQLKFSYLRLKDLNLQHCFLTCALYPEDRKIPESELISLWIAEGFVTEMDSNQAEFDKGRVMLNKLINNFLLEGVETNTERCVYMHDLMRDMALRITSVRPRFLVRARMELEDIPAVEEWSENLDKVSLMDNGDMNIPPQMQPPKCQMLTTLLLSNCRITSIPDHFFEHMHKLKVLDLSSNTGIKSLPNSISNLESLTALLLSGCKRLENVPSLSELEALKTLNLENTNIESLPHGMERLVNLKYLNLSGTNITQVPGGTLSKSSSLQQLLVGEIFVSGDEIGGLRKLEKFKGIFYNLKELSSYLQLQALGAPTQRPHRYYIVVSDEELTEYDSNIRYKLLRENEKFKYNRSIILIDCEIYKKGPNLPSDVEELVIDGCGVECSFEQVPIFSFCSFSSLVNIEISLCSNIKKLFSSDCVLKSLQNLAFLVVWDCEEMEEIIASESELEEEGMGSTNTIRQLALPNLRELRLWMLPKLKRICGANATMVCDSLKILKIGRCPELNRIPLKQLNNHLCFVAIS